MKISREYSYLMQNRHPLNYLQDIYINPILNNRLNYTHFKQLKSITISHTSNQILIHPNSLRSITYSMLILRGPFSKLIYIRAKKSMASFNIQKNNLLGIKINLTRFQYFQFIQNNIILQLNQISTRNRSIKNFIIVEDINKDYDLIVSIFPKIDQLGCRIAFNSSKKLNNDFLIELQRLNITN